LTYKIFIIIISKINMEDQLQKVIEEQYLKLKKHYYEQADNLIKKDIDAFIKELKDEEVDKILEKNKKRFENLKKNIFSKN